MRNIFLIVATLAILASCKKTTQLSGLYTESTPIAGRSHLDFEPGNIMIKTETGSAYKDAFSYLISGASITLTPLWSKLDPPVTLDFQVIDNNTLRIENLYAQIPEDPKVYMIYKK